MHMNSTVGLVLSGSVYLFAIAIAIWSLTAPYMTTTVMGVQIDEYVDKECGGGVCNTTPTSSNNKILYALYVILIILTGICFILNITHKHIKLPYHICCVLGLVLLFVALITMITLIIIVSMQTVPGAPTTYFSFTSASILMIIACCFIIIKQALRNKLLHVLPKKLLGH